MRRITRAGIRRRLSRARAGLGLFTRGDAWAEGAGPSGPEFAAWLERIGGRRAAGFPDRWRMRTDYPFAQPARVGVVLHAFYPELVDEILQSLSAIPVSFDLVVTNATQSPLTLDTAHLPLLRNSIVLDLDNHGRDILPLVSVVNAGLLDPYDLVLKVHTKHSPWRAEHATLGGSGSGWRAGLLAALLGSPENVRAILDAFAQDRSLGTVTADGSVLGPEFWGDNQPTVRTLLRRLELPLDEPALVFAAGSMYWTRGFILQGLRAFNLTAEDFQEEAGQVNATTAHALERVIGILALEAGYTIRERGQVGSDRGDWKRWEVTSPVRASARVIPFYLPQFHPVPENDRWWGTGFTEWTNVAAARPVFDGQHQPKIPRDMGFYDLRLDDVRRRQAELARAAGIAGFMYYYYWFTGKRLLERPIEALAASDIDAPFCIMWANENWTRRWDGRSSDVLIGQHYEDVPATEFIDDVMDFLKDPRYLRVGGRPVLAVYRIGQIPDFPDVAKHWRVRAQEEGVGDLFLLNVDVVQEYDGLVGTAQDNGLDGSLGFPPHNALWDWIPHAGLHVDRRFRGNLLSYASLVRDSERKLRGIHDGQHPGVMVTFDNTARRQWSSDVWFGSNPYTFRRWVSAAVSAVAHREADERIVFVNAWNEWAEGAVLEPSDRFGSTYLLAIRDVVHG